MNERIRELAEQAKAFIVEPEHASVSGVSEVSFDKFSDLEKFAELIVKRIIDNVECHASLFNTKEARQVCSWIVKSVKYDFGVEE